MERCQEQQTYGAECNIGCATNAEHTANVRIPLHIRPSASVCGVVVSCAGSPVVNCCRRNTNCRNRASYELIIDQPITLSVTMAYTAEAAPGTADLCCND
ncbi:MAG: hypothetical protein E7332_10080 [Clostridiales bacterium]|nr:hypothetical protein [Clostridiales bacterium]